MDAPGGGKTGDLLAGIAPGGRWVDARGTAVVVSWVRGIGVVGYRLADDADATDRVMDAARFLRNFAPTSLPPEKTTERAA